jgi:hypothetical protein
LGWTSSSYPSIPKKWVSNAKSQFQVHPNNNIEKTWFQFHCLAAALDGYRAPWSVAPCNQRNSTSMNFTCRRASISSKQQRDVALKAHVASVHFKYFRGTVQMFHTDVAKVD